MPHDANGSDFAAFVSRFGAVPIDMLPMLFAFRDALAERNIGPDFFRWNGTEDGKAALDDCMAKFAYAYRISIAGASELLQFLQRPGIIPVGAVTEKTRFEAFMLADYGVVEMTDRFRDFFTAHWIMPRPDSGISPYVLQVPASAEALVLAFGTRPYADCAILIELLKGAVGNVFPPLLTDRSNLLCMLSAGHDPCIVEARYDAGWHLDAHWPAEEPIFEPGCQAFVPVGTREKKLI